MRKLSMRQNASSSFGPLHRLNPTGCRQNQRKPRAGRFSFPRRSRRGRTTKGTNRTQEPQEIHSLILVFELFVFCFVVQGRTFLFFFAQVLRGVVSESFSLREKVARSD